MKVVDMHRNAIAKTYEDHRPGGNTSIRRNHLRTDLERMKTGDYGLQNFVLYTNMGREKELFLHTMELLGTSCQEMKTHQDLTGIMHCYRDIEEN